MTEKGKRIVETDAHKQADPKYPYNCFVSFWVRKPTVDESLLTSAFASGRPALVNFIAEQEQPISDFFE